MGNKFLDDPDQNWALDSSKHRLIANIYNAIRFLFNSRPKNEAVYLANLLGIDVSSIAQQAMHEDGMRILY